jgi:hypothetical protein
VLLNFNQILVKDNLISIDFINRAEVLCNFKNFTANKDFAHNEALKFRIRNKLLKIADKHGWDGVWTLHLLDVSPLDVSPSKPWSFHLHFFKFDKYMK